jgi:tetratricopeptide (TPR) repeat protein
VACFEQALSALAQPPEDRDTLEQAIDVRFDLRNALLPLGDEPRIFDHLHAAEALTERLNDLQRLGQITSYLCISLSTLGEYDRAIAAGHRTLALATTSGAFDVQVAAQTTLGQVYYTGGDFRQGLAAARRAMTLLTGERHAARWSASPRRAASSSTRSCSPS